MSAAPVLKPVSMADVCLTSLPTLFTTNTPHTFLSFPSSKPIIKTLHLSLISSHSPFLSLKNKLRSTPLVAQTSQWQEEEDDAVVKGEEDLGWSEEEGEQEGEGEESEWEGEEGGVVVAGEPEGDNEEEESYPEPPEEAKLFVGNLTFDMDSEKLARLFEQAGVVEVAEVIYNRETDQSRGFGFVTLSTVEEAENAVEMFHLYDVGGRLLTVNKAAPRGTRAERSQESNPSYKIYAGNLAWQVDDARLEQLFSEHGRVLDARVVCDRETGRSRGFGFVGMASKAEMDDVIAALDGQSLDGRALRVNVAEERPRRGSF